MKSIRIYQDINLSTECEITLDKSASNHLLRVLRLKESENFTLFNGDGYEYPATLSTNGKTAIAKISERITMHNESPLHIHLFQGISKGDRMDFAIQKAVELGVSHITPVFCARTVVNLKGDRLEKKRQHWQATVISACEQSGRNRVPYVGEPCSLADSFTLNPDNLKILLDPTASIKLNSLSPDNHQLDIFIGPEGGFTDQEIQQARDNQVNGVCFGPRILRTETAALSAIAACQLLWGDLS